MNPLTRYYIHQAGGGGSGGGVGPIYSVPPFVQRGHGLGSLLGGLFPSIRPLFFCGLRTAGKALGRDALRTGGKILTDIADNPQTGIKEIISKHVQSTVQNLGTKMTGRGRIRKRRSTSRAKKPKRTTKRTTKKKKKSTRKRGVTTRRNTPAVLYKKRSFRNLNW